MSPRCRLNDKLEEFRMKSRLIGLILDPVLISHRGTLSVKNRGEICQQGLKEKY